MVELTGIEPYNAILAFKIIMPEGFAGGIFEKWAFDRYITTDQFSFRGIPVTQANSSKPGGRP